MTLGSRTLFVAAGAVLAFAAMHGHALFKAYAAPNCHQSYPNIPGRVLLENDKVVVQRFVFPPGQWEGVHAYPPNQLFIHLKGGEWTVRYGRHQQTVTSPTGSVGWFGPVSLAQDHESVNSGTEPIDLIWVTLKEGCG